MKTMLLKEKKKLLIVRRLDEKSLPVREAGSLGESHAPYHWASRCCLQKLSKITCCLIKKLGTEILLT